MILLHPHVPGHRESDQESCWTALHSLDLTQWFDAVYDIAIDRNMHMMWPRWLQREWGKNDLVILEHDIVPTSLAFEFITQCSEENCAMDYHIQVSPYRTIPPHKVHQGPTLMRGMRSDENWADVVGLGLCKISKHAQLQTSWPPIATWKTMDFFLSAAVRKRMGMWHIHRPAVEHVHTMLPARNPLERIR